MNRRRLYRTGKRWFEVQARPDSAHMIVTVLLFAAARELADEGQIKVEVPDEDATSIGVIEAIQTQYPVLAEIVQSSVLAVNHEYVDQHEARPVSDRDEVALIPPVSGG